VMTDRSSRGSDKPVIGRCALTQHKCWGPDPQTSSRPAVMRPHHKAGHMAAHGQIVKTQKPLATQAPSTQVYREFADDSPACVRPIPNVLGGFMMGSA